MTEQEKFDKWAFNPISAGYPLRNPHEALLAWLECAGQKQAEIDALRKELEQVKMHNMMLLSVAEKVWDKVCFGLDENKLTAEISHAITATSEQVEAYRAEIIAQAKAAQWESDYAVVFDLPEIADIPDALEAIRNNKE